MIHFAPIQGHTDAPYRHFHAEQFGGENITYYTPFIRLEHGEVRRKDENDALSSLNANHKLVTQLIFRNEAELQTLMQWCHAHNVKHININMGCPFPLQTAKGRGAATVASHEAAMAVKNVVNDALAQDPDLELSVKMRLGMKNPSEWHNLIDVLNSLPLNNISVHPRVAKQQYGGEVDLNEYKQILEASSNPVIYNGDIRTPEDAIRIMEMAPATSGIMIGRGLLSRPSLAEEIQSGKIWDADMRLQELLRLHRTLMNYYEENLIGGEHQVLSKIKPFWEYAEAEIGRKAWKAIKKASNMAKYHSAVALIGL